MEGTADPGRTQALQISQIMASGASDGPNRSPLAQIRIQDISVVSIRAAPPLSRRFGGADSGRGGAVGPAMAESPG